MSLAHLVIHAAVQAFAEALGVSGAAHGLALGLWLPAPERGPIAGAIGLGAGVATVIALRARLRPAFAEAGRALGYPALFFGSTRAREVMLWGWICAVSGGLGLALRRVGVVAPPAPRSLAIGLGATGLMLVAAAYRASDRGEPGAEGGERGAASRADRGTLAGVDRAAKSAADRGWSEVPSLLGATLVGLVHGCSVWPGVSRVGVAIAALVWLGVRPARALETALIVTVPFWWVDFVAALPELRAFGMGHLLLATLLAFFAAYGSISVLRGLARKRALVVLSLWMIPLAAAILAYGRAGSPLL